MRSELETSFTNLGEFFSIVVELEQLDRYGIRIMHSCVKKCTERIKAFFVYYKFWFS